MSFFSDLRDDTAGPLIIEFGQAATYVFEADTAYDPSSGEFEYPDAQETTVYLLDLPIKSHDFSDELVAAADRKFLVSAQQFAAASVVPVVNSHILLYGKRHMILGINPVGPSGEVVIYKMAVTSA